MPDWTSSMKQTFEYYIVDPGTWKNVKRLDNVKTCDIQSAKLTFALIS